MRYVRADIQQVNRSEWRGYIEEFHVFFHGVSQDETKETAHRIIEETTGLNEFQIIWNRC